LIRDGFECATADGADSTINGAANPIEFSGTSGEHTSATCHQLCQDDPRCEAFDVFDDSSSASKCSLYRNGICKATA
jgi:hypothetical protein